MRYRWAALLCTLLAACASTESYRQRIGLLAAERQLLDHYERILREGDLGELGALFASTAQEQAPPVVAAWERTLLGGDGTRAPVLFAETEVREFDLWTEPLTSKFRFTLGLQEPTGRRWIQATAQVSFVHPEDDDSSGTIEFGIPTRKVLLAQHGELEFQERRGGRPQFEEVAAARGIAHRHRNESVDSVCLVLAGTMPGGGGAALDYDRDGWMDLCAADGQSSRLFRNRGDGSFEDRSEESGLAAVTGAGVVAADYDNDGFEDLYLCNHFGSNTLLHNLGDGTFEDVTEQAGVAVGGACLSAAFADYDRDGDLDLFVPVAGDYFRQVPNPPFAAADGDRNRLFRNNGDGTFTDVAEAAGINDTGWGLVAAFHDFDVDGHPDLYVVNDFGPNYLYRNRGDGTFEDVSAETGTYDRGYGMGISFGDYDADGDLDLYVSNIYSEYGPIYRDGDFPLPLLGRVFRGWVSREFQRMLAGNTLLQSDGAAGFVDVGKELGVNECGWSWAGMFLDMENDGDLDLYVPNGSFRDSPPERDLELPFWAMSSYLWEQQLGTDSIMFDARGRSLHGHEHNRLFERDQGEYRETAFLHHVDSLRLGRGLVLADFNNDGFVDLFVRNLNDQAEYFENRGGPGRWIRLTLTGTRSNRDAVGARVTLRAGERLWLQELRAGEGYFSSHDKRLLFGLGDTRTVDVEVVWPTGQVEVWTDLDTNKSYTLEEGSTTCATHLGG